MRKRVLALVCCLSLTLGLFTYRPPEAKAIVTEASLATSVLWSFMQSAGITFNGTGMNSSSWAEAIEPYLRDFTEWKDSAAKSFWHWLGYDGASEFIKALSWSKITHPTTMPFPSVVIPPAVAKKMGEFTHWFVEKVGLSSGGESKPVYSSSGSTYLRLADGSKFYFFSVDYDQFNSSGGWHNCKSSLGLGTIALDLGTGKTAEKRADFTLSSGATFSIWVLGGEKSYLQGRFEAGSVRDSYSSFDFSTAWMYENSYDSIGLFVGPDGRIRPILHNIKTGLWGYSTSAFMGNFTLSALNGVSEGASSADAVQPGALSPTYDDNGEKPTVVAYPNIDGNLTSINDLLQQILDKLSANELDSSASLEGEAAPDVPATDIGWKGTIEKIYQAIIDLPGRIADAFKALLEGLFAPDTALMQEISTTFTDKFPFLPVLNRVGKDLFGMTANSEPPVIWIHLEDAEGKYTYGDKTKVLDMSFYQRYKADADKLISGFLWLGFLWLLFKRASAIIQGSEMLTEYSEAIDRGYRERKGKKTK